MKKKPASRYQCEKCGTIEIKDYSVCPGCGEYGSLQPLIEPTDVPTAGFTGTPATTKALNAISSEDVFRYQLSLSSLNRILGDGLAKNSVILLSGEPGAGKSTMLLQLAAEFSASSPVVYASGEESLPQIHDRALRLGLSSESLFVSSKTLVADILEEAVSKQAKLLIVDSIQTALPSASMTAGSLSASREATVAFTRFAKTSDCTVILIGHVTKDGHIAGPKSLEHIVDTVLSVEALSDMSYRQFQVGKNRFGIAGETAIFELTAAGFREVSDPSNLFITARDFPPGVVLSSIPEGSSPLLVEFQTLASTCYGEFPRRAAVGFDRSRFEMLLAILGNTLRLPLHKHDFYLNVANGLKVFSPSSDIAVLVAIFSSLHQFPISSSDLFLGEVSLSQELRPVPGVARILRMAARNGFKRVFLSEFVPDPVADDATLQSLQICRFKNVKTLLESLQESAKATEVAKAALHLSVTPPRLSGT